MVLPMTGLILATILMVSTAATPKDAVIEYVKNLPLCMKTGMSIFVSEIVDKKIARRLQIWIDAWRLSGYSPYAVLLDIKFKEIRMDGKEAVVITEEKWQYSYTYLNSGEVALPPQYIFYEISYKLKKEGEGWKIYEIDILKEVSNDGCGPDCKL